MLPGEVIRSGAPKTCRNCLKHMEDEVRRSAAGYYIGTICHCGPIPEGPVTTEPMRMRRRRSCSETTSGTNPNPKLSIGKPD